MEHTTVIRFRWTADDLLRAQRYHFRHTCRPVFRLALHLLIALAIVGGYGQLQSGKSVAVGVVLLVGGIYWFAIRPFERRWMTRRQFAKRPDKDIEIEWLIAPDKLAAKSGLGHGESDWHAFTKAVRTPAGLLLYPNDQMYHWLPRHAFESNTDYDRVVELVKSRIKRFYDVG